MNLCRESTVGVVGKRKARQATVSSRHWEALSMWKPSIVCKGHWRWLM
jgi:hypothetical protein